MHDTTLAAYLNMMTKRVGKHVSAEPSAVASKCTEQQKRRGGGSGELARGGDTVLELLICEERLPPVHSLLRVSAERQRLWATSGGLGGAIQSSGLLEG
ncbi:hypothetical protein NDU88_005627 [Pleurodeles waltl]|uniref:Uncharacterized protein n=1 Tax=Pleurodeles waltl TaxID=8319 RepID=A0AAV7TVD4_PLEWA|nr:hypothetical protein NDU88_005627 [Pleurodeles waltl]